MKKLELGICKQKRKKIYKVLKLDGKKRLNTLNQLAKYVDLKIDEGLTTGSNISMIRIQSLILYVASYKCK